jgi:Cdc6-like AAA superfamily ATPase
MGPFLVVVHRVSVFSQVKDRSGGKSSRSKLTKEIEGRDPELKTRVVRTIEEASLVAFEASQRGIGEVDSNLAGVGIVVDPHYQPQESGESPTLNLRFAEALARAASPGQILTCLESHRAVCAAKLKDFASRPLGQHVILEDYPVCEVYQLEHKDAPVSFPPIASIRPVIHNLGNRFAPFFGRNEELRAVTSLLTDSAIVTITGEPGIGKSSLAWRVALEYCDDLQGGVWKVTCLDHSQRDDLLSSLSNDIQKRTVSRLPMHDAIVKAFSGKSGLIIVDRCDRSLRAATEAIKWLLEACPEVTLLLTARSPLKIAGETTYRLGPLQVPQHLHADDLQTLLSYDGPRLFVDRIQQLEPTWEPAPDDIGTILDICKSGNGHPAILIAYATEAAYQGVGKVREAVLSNPQSVSKSRNPRAERFWKLIEQSYSRLSIGAKNLASRLFAMYSDCTPEIALGLMGVDSQDIQKDLVELSDAGLLEMVVDEEGIIRYSLPDHFASFLQKNLTPSEKADGERDHCRYYLGVAQQARELYTSSKIKPAMLIWEEVYPNVRLALARSMAAHRPESLKLFNAIGAYLLRNRPAPEGAELATRICDGFVNLPSREGADALNFSGAFFLMLQSFEKAAAFYERAYQMACEVEYPSAMANSQANLMITSRHVGDMQAAVDAGEKAVR